MRSITDTYFKIILVLFVVAAAHLSARVTSSFIARSLWQPRLESAKPLAERAVGPSFARLEEYKSIEERNLFNDNPPPPGAPQGETKPAQAAAAPVAPPPPPPQDYQLVGTVVINDGNSLAIFSRGEETFVTRKGREVAPGTLLSEIKKDRVVLSVGAEKRELMLFSDKQPARGGARQPAGASAAAAAQASAAANQMTQTDTIKQLDSTSWAVDRKEIDQAVSNMSQLITQLRVVPNMVDGQTQGFKVFNIRPGSLFTQIGIQDGDIVKEINGAPMNGIDVAYQAMANLQNQTSIQLTIVRRNQPLTFSYEIR